jgi:nucleotide-binding universal stress UspA family protein
MYNYRHIAVGTDFSLQSEAAINKAIAMATCRSSRLSIVHIIDERASNRQDIMQLSPLEVEEMLLQEVRRKLSTKLTNHELASIACEAHVIFGKPEREILNFVRAENADLLVVGQRETNFLKHLLLGSTAQHLLRQSPVPIMVVSTRRKHRCQKILVATDLSSPSRKLISHTLDMACEKDSQLHILYVEEKNTLSMLTDLIPRPTSLEAQQAQVQLSQKFETFIQSFDFQGISYNTHIRSGNLVTEIGVCAEKIGADLLVLGRTGHIGLKGMIIGSVAERMAPILTCSLLTIPN